MLLAMNSKQSLLFLLFVSLVIAVSLQSQKDTNPSPTIQTASINLPVPLDNPNIRQVSLFYSFYGRVKLIETIGDDMQLILDSSDTNLPAFILNSKNSQIMKFDGSGSYKPASADTLKTGLTVNIQMMYDLRLHTWKLTRVYIF